MSLISRVKKIDALYFAGDGRPQAFDAARIATKGSMIVAQLSNGRIWTNHENFRKFAYLPGNYRGMDNLLDCLVKLKIITRAEVREHKQSIADYHKADALRYDQKSLDRLHKKYGLGRVPILKKERV